MEAVLRILLITQWFDPEPTFKGLAFAHALRERGHDVQVITGFPNYPGGEVYSGYKLKWFQRETMDGVEVCRLPLYPSHDGSAIGRALNYISFAITSCLFGILFSRKADVIYAYHPPLTVGMSAAVAGFFRRTPVVYDIQDMWPDTLKATGMLNNPKALSLIGWICKWIYRRAAALVVLSPGFKQLLVERGVSEQKVKVIYNWCDAKALSQPTTLIKPEGMQNRFNVVFAGTMGRAQALDAVITAAAIVAKTHPFIQFVFVGGGMDVERLKQFALDQSPENVLFLPRMSMTDVAQVLYAADLLMVHLREDPLFAITVPSKTQAYMAVGKPILMAVRGDAANIIRDAECGIVVEPEQADQIARAVIDCSQLSEDRLVEMGQKGLAYYQKNLSIQTGVDEFVKIFNSVQSSSSGAPL